MFADFGLLPRALGEQHLYREHRNVATGGERLSTNSGPNGRENGVKSSDVV